MPEKCPHHEDDATDGKPPAQAGGWLPLKLHPAVRGELEHDPLHLASGKKSKITTAASRKSRQEASAGVSI